MAITLVRVGNFEGDLKKVSQQYHPEVEEMVDPLNLAKKYGILNIRPSYLTIVSRAHKQNPLTDYNLILAITSEEPDLNEEEAKKFELASAISLRKSTNDLEESMQLLSGIVFNKHKKDPRIMMGLLKDMSRK